MSRIRALRRTTCGPVTATVAPSAPPDITDTDLLWDGVIHITLSTTGIWFNHEEKQAVPSIDQSWRYGMTIEKGLLGHTAVASGYVLATRRDPSSPRVDFHRMWSRTIHLPFTNGSTLTIYHTENVGTRACRPQAARGCVDLFNPQDGSTPYPNPALHNVVPKICISFTMDAGYIEHIAVLNLLQISLDKYSRLKDIEALEGDIRASTHVDFVLAVMRNSTGLRTSQDAVVS
ncbi:hypothetical protein B0H10DRAFT_1947522 [Mycena sp. CBHHK59/15]|nr:hypothetical protein B0H10DRAFT_1947522 [Mycena sp. CBHHK59/15]